ncbi:hypothetical protein CSPX01_12934 [Colletotrichum filicis]|nr:hypothetical protein CSPX01_12934 [Colletotrichum filicis]
MNSRPTMMSSLMKTLTPSQKIRNLVNVNNYPPFAWNSVLRHLPCPRFSLFDSLIQSRRLRGISLLPSRNHSPFYSVSFPANIMMLHA